MSASPKTLVIIPAYNEALAIPDLIKKLSAIKIPRTDFLIVNDGSKDNTSECILKNRPKDFPLKLIELPLNLGIGGAVQTGYQYAFENGYDYAIQLDADGQHPPENLALLIDFAIKNNSDLVVGSRFKNRPKNSSDFKSSFMRRLGITWLSRLIQILSGKRVYDVTSGFRLSGKKLIKSYAKSYPSDYPEPEALAFALAKKLAVDEIYTPMKARHSGVSSISTLKSVYYIFKVSLGIILGYREGKKKV